MKIALDFDDTYTLNHLGWNEIIFQLISLGHEVKFVTYRPDIGEINFSNAEDSWSVDNTILNETADLNSIDIIYCGSRQKEHVCADLGWIPDLWIDDNPQTCMSFDSIIDTFTKCKDNNEFTDCGLNKLSGKMVGDLTPMSDIVSDLKL